MNVAYGCGLIAGKTDVLDALRPRADNSVGTERPFCADYRKLWEAK